MPVQKWLPDDQLETHVGLQALISTMANSSMSTRLTQLATVDTIKIGGASSWYQI